MARIDTTRMSAWVISGHFESFARCPLCPASGHAENPVGPIGRSTIDALPEIIAAVNNRMTVIVDSGFRRGTDVVKSLAMGAHAAGIGRPYLWGLGAFGQEGVERVLDLIRTETRAAMQQCGARSVKELNPSFVRRAT